MLKSRLFIEQPGFFEFGYLFSTTGKGYKMLSRACSAKHLYEFGGCSSERQLEIITIFLIIQVDVKRINPYDK